MKPMILAIAGLTLAVTSALVSKKIIEWETKRRRENGVPSMFNILSWGERRSRAI